MITDWLSREATKQFVSSVIGRDIDFGECQALAVLDRNQSAIAGVVFHDWRPDAGTIELSAASIDRRWMTRPVMREVFGYVFDVCGCQLAVARCHEDNWPVRRIWQALGADEIIIPRLEGRFKAGVVHTLTDDAWRQSRFARD